MQINFKSIEKSICSTASQIHKGADAIVHSPSALGRTALKVAGSALTAGIIPKAFLGASTLGSAAFAGFVGIGVFAYIAYHYNLGQWVSDKIEDVCDNLAGGSKASKVLGAASDAFEDVKGKIQDGIDAQKKAEREKQRTESTDLHNRIRDKYHLDKKPNEG